MNSFKLPLFIAAFFTVSFSLQAQQKITQMDFPIVLNVDVEQTQIDSTLENQKHTDSTLSGINAVHNISKDSIDAYTFNFNHKQFLKPIIRKSAYC